MNPKTLTKHRQKYEKHIQEAEDYILLAYYHRDLRVVKKYYNKARKHFLKAKYHKNWFKTN